MFTPLLSAQPSSRLATPRLVTRLTGAAALAAALAVSACDDLKIGAVPQCSVLQPSCSGFGPVPAEPAAAASASPATAAAPRPPATDATSMSQ